MSALPLLALAPPLAMLVGCVSPALRDRIAGVLPFASAPAVIVALLAGLGPADAPLRLPAALYRVTLVLDAPAALLLGAAALLWTCAAITLSDGLRERADRGRVAVWWLLTLTGSFGVFMAADLVGFYFMFALVSLPAYGLIVDDATTPARRAGGVYIALAVLGEAFLLMAFILLAQAAPGGLLIRDAVAALPGSPWPNAACALLILGFGVKIGLVPLHVWMPLAYTASPIPMAAVLSGAAVKAGIIGLIRFLPFGATLPGSGEALGLLGFVAAFYGVAIGVTQQNPKTILAYSSVSQMGLTAAVLGLGLAHQQAGVTMVAGFYAAHHVLVKGGLFLAIGLARRIAPPRRFFVVLLPAWVVSLGLAGLPLTGGAVAKAAIKGPLGDGLIGTLGALSAAGTTLLMLHFLAKLAATPRSDAVLSSRAAGPWLVVAGASIVAPWVLFVPLGLSGWADVLGPEALWSALWPILVGTAAAMLLHGKNLPIVPAGDLVALLERATVALPGIGRAVERLDASLRQWTIAGLSLLLLVAGLGLALFAGR